MNVKRVYWPTRGNVERKVYKAKQDGYTLVGVGMGFFCQLLIFNK